MDKKSSAKPGNADAMAYQEPHGVDAVHGKFLEEAIGREVKRFREKLGITISELSKAAGMSAGMLSKIENGATSPGRWQLWQSSANEIVFGSKPPRHPTSR